jgi:hypothetical protein
MTENPAPPLYCVNHPQRETMLRCNRCERPICGECAVLTPTGYRCKDCVRGQQKRFDNAQSPDYIIGVLFALLLSFAGSFLPAILGFFTIFIAPIIGMISVSIVQRLVKHRRSQTLFLATAGAAAIGSLPLLVMTGLNVFGAAHFGFLSFAWLTLLWQGLYTFLITSTVFYRMSGIQL